MCILLCIDINVAPNERTLSGILLADWEKNGKLIICQFAFKSRQSASC